ncbi:MAG: hypothetical protein A2W31_16165 [Planctomycetes bacterium RBG_16_64_10]|nr:MAG: hypothetical protein A2W31_16165 [Planctomycetes bacterium RBG_16_64_10]
MMRDPIVEEIRRIRQEHAARFKFDLDAIFEDLKEKERQSKREIVSRPPRPARAVVPTSRVDRR